MNVIQAQKSDLEQFLRNVKELHEMNQGNNVQAPEKYTDGVQDEPWKPRTILKPQISPRRMNKNVINSTKSDSQLAQHPTPSAPQRPYSGHYFDNVESPTYVGHSSSRFKQPQPTQDNWGPRTNTNTNTNSNTNANSNNTNIERGLAESYGDIREDLHALHPDQLSQQAQTSKYSKRGECEGMTKGGGGEGQRRQRRRRA